MRSIAPARGIALSLALAGLGLAFAPAAQALECEGVQRVFEGEVQDAGEKTIVVDNKKGDKIKFTRPDPADVSGEKTSWDDLSRGDWVAICFKTLDRPRWAYKVEVVPEPADED